MNSRMPVILGIAALALSILACQAVIGGSGNPTPAATPTQSTTAGVLMTDDFTSENWGTATDSDSSVAYANGALQVIVYTPDYFVWSTPDNQNYQDIHMEATVINNNTDPATAFGLMCSQQSGDNNSFYYLAVTPAGQYAIAKAAAGQNDLFLTNNDAWGDSPAIPRNAASYRIGADCGRGRLTLYVNGQQVDSISEASYSSGGIGVMVWSGKEATSTNVAFDDFVMTGLQ